MTTTIESRQAALLELTRITPRIPESGMREAARTLGDGYEQTLDAMLATGLLMESEGWVFNPRDCL